MGSDKSLLAFVKLGLARSLLVLLLSSSSAFTQTIHVDDIDYFVGMFGVRDSSGSTVVDCSKFVDWFLAAPDSTGRRSLAQIKYTPPYSLWVYDWSRLSDQASTIKWHRPPNARDSGLAGYRYFIMQDYTGWEMQRNVLTVWKTVGCDSLQYVCGQADSFETGIGHAGVEFVTPFPDGSLLMVVNKSGEGTGAYRFYRATEPCHFEQFHSYNWRPVTDDRADGEYATVDLRYLSELFPNYTVVARREYVRHPEMNHEIVDSVSYQVIDLWKLAREFFNLEAVDSSVQH